MSPHFILDILLPSNSKWINNINTFHEMVKCLLWIKCVKFLNNCILFLFTFYTASQLFLKCSKQLDCSPVLIFRLAHVRWVSFQNDECNFQWRGWFSRNPSLKTRITCSHSLCRAMPLTQCYWGFFFFLFLLDVCGVWINEKFGRKIEKKINKSTLHKRL